MLWVAATAAVTPAGAAEGEVAGISRDAAFAHVDGRVITVGEFETGLINAMRGQFFHGRPPEDEFARFQHEVSQQLIDRVLLEIEAARRGFEADAARVDAELARFRERYGEREDWVDNRERIRAELQRRDLVMQLQHAVAKAAGNPEGGADAAIADYYAAHPDKFTEPERLRVSLILLGVDPGAGAPAWQAAREEAAGLVERLRDGADFAALARLHSSDGSAEQGGDMGYLHSGMIAPEAEQAAAELAPGEITEPVTTLQGIAILRLDDRRAARLLPLAEVAERARGLWLRDSREQRWSALLERLRAETPVSVREDLLLPLGAAEQSAESSAASG